MRDFIDPNHLLIRIYEQLDFAKLVAPLEEPYCSDFGRPAVHPEVMVRALLICSLYNIASFRRLCSAISENLAYRWFCFLTIDDPVFDHSTINHFIERVGREGFAAIFRGLNEELLRLGLLSPEMYADASLVKTNASSFGLVSSGMTVSEFEDLAVEENGLFVLTETEANESGVDNEEVRYYQDPKGRLPLNPVDTEAHWLVQAPCGTVLSGQLDRRSGRLHRSSRGNPRVPGRMESSAGPAGATAHSAGVTDHGHRIHHWGIAPDSGG